jgi:lysozyme
MASRKQKAIAGACAISVGLTAGFEGLRLYPNPDPAHPQLQQVCYGDTQVEMRRYTATECQMLLQARQASDYAPIVLNCVPAFSDPRHRNEFAASVDAAYNGGPVGTAKHPGFCRSVMAARFNAGDWAGGCNAFLTWHTMPGTRVHNGLVRRRKAEQALCLKGLGNA